MRLLSSFYDYYDCMAKYDEYRGVIYFRKTEKIERQKGILNSQEWHHEYEFFRDCPIVVGFCGRLYPGIPIYDMDQFPSLVDVLWSKDQINDYFRDEWKNDNRKWRSKAPKTYEDIMNRAKDRDLLTKHAKICVWAEYTNYIVYHPCLRDLFFQKVISPAQAWMQLNSWHDNVARPIKEAPTIDDVTMAEAKGFNKWSFRKEPSKKKR